MADIMKLGEKNPNYLGSFDLDDIPSRELTLTIKDFKEEEITTNGQKQVVTICCFVEDYKPMIFNATNKKRLVKLYGTKQSEKLAGKLITICTEKVKAFGEIHDALRVKKVIPTAKAAPIPKCENCGADILPAGNMNAEQVAVYTKGKYGQALCSTCATAKAKEV